MAAALSRRNAVAWQAPPRAARSLGVQLLAGAAASTTLLHPLGPPQVLLRHRSLRNYTRLSYVAPRVFDRVAIAFLLITLYWGLGERGPGRLGERAWGGWVSGPGDGPVQGPSCERRVRPAPRP